MFWASLRNTLFFAVVVVPVQAGFALVLALLVNAKVRGDELLPDDLLRAGRHLDRRGLAAVEVPVPARTACSTRCSCGVTFGHFTPIDWLNDPSTAMPAIMLMSIWQAVGFHMIIWLAGLQTIPAELYEAADLDGATGWQQFRYVTWPGLLATRTFILVTITISALSLFYAGQRDDAGRPARLHHHRRLQAVRTGYQQQATGYASAISLVFFVLVLTVSAIQRYLTREKD